MAQPKDLTGHIQEIIAHDKRPDDALPPEENSAKSPPLARDGFAGFIYSLLFLAAFMELALIFWMNLL